MTDVAVLGGTGKTGRLLLAELLRRGHRVTVLVRDPDRLGVLAGRVRTISGDSRDPAAMAALVDGADAVLSALGRTNKDPTLLEQDLYMRAAPFAATATKTIKRRRVS